MRTWFSINQNHQESVSEQVSLFWFFKFSINQNHQESVSLRYRNLLVLTFSINQNHQESVSPLILLQSFC